MIRKPSYKQFLNHTRDVQSSINLSANAPSASFLQSLDSSQNEIKFRQTREERPWENTLLDVIKYIPDNPRALRHTYVKEPFPKSNLDDSFSNSFQMASPKKERELLKANRNSTFTHTRSRLCQEPKAQANQFEPTLEFSRCNANSSSRPIEQIMYSQNKPLYQSHSNAKPIKLRSDDSISKEIEKLKQLRNRRMQNNATIMYKFEDKVRSENKMARVPKTSISIHGWGNKQKQNHENAELEKSIYKEKGYQERNQKSKSPINILSSQYDPNLFAPLQFRRKPSNDGRNTSNNLAKSPIKSTSRATSNLSSSSQLYEPLKPSKPINTKLTLEDFTLGKKLGEGRFGVVWLAIHKLTGAIFALKKIAKSIIKESFMIDQFILEVKIQSFIEHSYIVNIFGIFDDEESIYLLLEYLEGGTLYNSLKKKSNGKFQDEEVGEKINMICEAVRCLHQKGIAHRDIKPQNIIITNEICKLGDFGWATSCDHRRKTYCGTTDYVAPEIVEGREYNMSVDLWCIGVLVYELLSGRAPFYHISRQQTFNKIKNVDSSSLNYPKYFSENAIDFIGKLIKKNPNERMDMEIALKHPFLAKFN